MRCKEQTITFYPDIHSEKARTEVFPETRLAFETSGSTAVATAAANFSIEDGKSYIVENGLNEGDIIIAEGAGLMKDGLEVEIQNSGLSNYYVN